MSLRSDVTFVTTLILGAIRQILGETLRTMADYLLKNPQVVPPPEPPKVEVAPVHQRRTHKATPQREPISQESPPEVLTKPTKPRDRSKYNPKDHGPYKIAAIGILQILSVSGRLSVPALAKGLPNSTDSSIRTACKTMVKDGILATEFSSDARSNVYWIADREATRIHLAELEESAPLLPTSNESGEPETSLN